jgi:cell division control protein 6
MLSGQSYDLAKQSLHTAKPDHLVGRDQEVSEVSGFLRSHLDLKTAGSLYVSGAPGTGKMAALLHIIDDFKVH